jgi:hypothetical protein
MKRLGTILTITTALATMAAPALAQRRGAPLASAKTASVYAIHAISGDDLGFARSLPVDVRVNGALCAIQNFKFGDVAGPLSLPPGTYGIEVLYPAGNCSGSPVITKGGINVDAGKSYTIVAHFTVDANGDFLGQSLNQIIGATAFENSVAPTGSGRARLAAHHTARAPEVDVVVTREFYDPNAPSIEVSDFANGDSATAPIKPGEWAAALKLAGTNTVALGPATLSLKPFTGYFVYAIGSAVTGSLDLRVISIPNLK